MRHADRQVVIVGGNRLQNELLEDLFIRELGCRCGCEENLAALAERGPNPVDLKRLILLDCAGLDGVRLQSIYGSSLWKQLDRDCRVLFNFESEPGGEQTALNFGVRGVFPVGDGPTTLLKGIRAIFHGDLWVSRKTLIGFFDAGRKRLPAAKLLLPGLSFRETEVLEQLAEGCSNQEIADKLCISPFTVKAHLNTIFRKIKVNNRLQAVRWRAQQIVDRMSQATE